MNPITPIIKKTVHAASIAPGAAYYEIRAMALLGHLITMALCSRPKLTAEEIKILIGKKRRRRKRR